MKICYIFGAALGLPKEFKRNSDDLVIAADAGLLSLQKLKVVPDITVGDFDSLKSIPNDGEVIKHPVKKDDTDTLLAVRIGHERGYKNFIIYGGTGNRLDHTLANLQTLNFIAENGGNGILCGDGYCATAVVDGTLRFKAKKSGNVSVFAAGGMAEGVSIKGLLYPLKNATLSYAFPLGVSNEFMGEEAEISVKSGALTVIWEGVPTDVF